MKEVKDLSSQSGDIYSEPGREFVWRVKVKQKGDEYGKLPTFITHAELYVTASSAKEACWLAERYLKNLQPINVISVELWDNSLTTVELYERAIESMRRYSDEQKNCERPFAEDLRTEQCSEP